jgi:hypothetical protein
MIVGKSWLGTVLLLGVLLPQLAGASEAQAPRVYGAPLTLEEAIPLSQVLAAPERYAEEPVLLQGRLTDLCQRKGCWTVLQDGDAVVRVRFRDYGFFLPKDALGSVALVEGVASVRELSEREARHLEAESRGGDPARIEGPQREVGIVASGVRLAPAE